MGARLDLSYSGIGEMLNSEFMQQEMRSRAEAVKALAEVLAPVGDPDTDPHAGRYKASFSVSSGRHGGFHRDRAYGRVVNSAPEALWIEMGSKHNPRYRVLGAALSAAGGH